MENGAELVTSVVGGTIILMISIVKMYQWLGPILKLPGSNGKKEPVECPIKKDPEFKELSRRKLEHLEQHSVILKEIRDSLIEQKVDHRVMLDRLNRS